jgi:hypothetical protein
MLPAMWHPKKHLKERWQRVARPKRPPQLAFYLKGRGPHYKLIESSIHLYLLVSIYSYIIGILNSHL